MYTFRGIKLHHTVVMLLGQEKKQILVLPLQQIDQRQHFIDCPLPFQSATSPGQTSATAITILHISHSETPRCVVLAGVLYRLPMAYLSTPLSY